MNRSRFDAGHGSVGASTLSRNTSVCPTSPPTAAEGRPRESERRHAGSPGLSHHPRHDRRCSGGRCFLLVTGVPGPSGASVGRGHRTCRSGPQRAACFRESGVGKQTAARTVTRVYPNAVAEVDDRSDPGRPGDRSRTCATREVNWCSRLVRSRAGTLYGGGEVADNDMTQLTSNRIAVTFAKPERQRRDPAFVLSPQIPLPRPMDGPDGTGPRPGGATRPLWRGSRTFRYGPTTPSTTRSSLTGRAGSATPVPGH